MRLPGNDKWQVIDGRMLAITRKGQVMGIFGKSAGKGLAAGGIVAALMGGHGADKARDNYAKGKHKENKANSQRVTGRRQDTYSSMKK
jgi:hypothetical protein